MRVYLCGPMTGCTDEEASGWRKEASLRLSRWSILCLDPMVRDYRNNYTLENSKAIVEEDKLDIQLSDVVLVNYYKPSVGTSMEIIHAWERNRRVILVCAEGTQLSPWLIYHSHNIYHTFEEAYQKIRELQLTEDL